VTAVVTRTHQEGEKKDGLKTWRKHSRHLTNHIVGTSRRKKVVHLKKTKRRGPLELGLRSGGNLQIPDKHVETTGTPTN